MEFVPGRERKDLSRVPSQHVVLCFRLTLRSEGLSLVALVAQITLTRSPYERLGTEKEEAPATRASTGLFNAEVYPFCVSTTVAGKTYAIAPGIRGL